MIHAPCSLRSISGMLLLVLLLPGLARAQPPKEHPVITEFKKYISSPEVNVRVDQIHRLERVGTVEAVELLIKKGLLDSNYRARDAAIEILAKMEGEARQAVFEALSSPKGEVRAGVALAIGRMPGLAPADAPTAALTKMVEKDRNSEAVISATEALGLLKFSGAIPVLSEALEHRDEAVVIAAAESMGIIGDPAAAPALVTSLNHLSWRVQVAALSALGKARSKVAVGPLIDYLHQAVGRPREDARRALVRVTGRTFGMGSEQWYSWWERAKDRFEVPPLPEKEDEVEAEAGGTDGYGRQKPTRYHRLKTYSKRILFVIDVSTSMETPILVKAGKRDEKTDLRYGGTPKIKIAREELKFALDGMDKETQFNIIAFETDVRKWKNQAVPATPANVQAALRWIEKQKARHGGATDSDGRIVGRTNTYGALAAAFGLKVDSKRGTGGVTGGSPRGKRRPKWDTCFFLSDGRPTEGFTTNVDEILNEVRRWNRTCKMVINCIGMERQNGLTQLLNGLADITGGKAVFLGK